MTGGNNRGRPLYQLVIGTQQARDEHAALMQKFPDLGACRAWGVDSEKRPQRGQFLPDLQAHSSTMGQKAGKKWTAEAVSQPTIPKSDRLLAHDEPCMAHVAPGKTGAIVLTFNRAGEFGFACLIADHYQAGMVGRVIVAARPTSPSNTAPQKGKP